MTDESWHHRERREARAISGLLVCRWAARLATAGLDLIFPPRCAGCGRVDARWCERCQRELEALPVNLCIQSLPPLSASAATGIHEGILQHAVHALKYRRARDLAAPLGNRLAACLDQLGWQIDLVIPVPLHTSRIRSRGYNQAHLLGGHMARLESLPCVPSALVRLRPTPPQVGLNREQRQKNMEDAFSADAALVAARRVLLVDDVQTTGATLQSCALAALDAGATAVYSITVSVARSGHRIHQS
jgi:ComF family protein